MLTPSRRTELKDCNQEMHLRTVGGVSGALNAMICLVWKRVQWKISWFACRRAELKDQPGDIPGSQQGVPPGSENSKINFRDAQSCMLRMCQDACRRAELKDHSREVLLAASKGSPKGSAEARCAPRFGGGGAKRHAGHQVFQPSGRFY